MGNPQEDFCDRLNQASDPETEGFTEGKNIVEKNSNLLQKQKNERLWAYNYIEIQFVADERRQL